jgi:hypothetical protein
MTGPKIRCNFRETRLGEVPKTSITRPLWKGRKRRSSATRGIQLPALEILLHVCPGGMHQLGVDEDLLYLDLAAVAAHVFLF